MGLHEGKVPLGISRARGDDNINMDIKVLGWGGVDWIDLVQCRDSWRALVHVVMKIWFP